MKTITRTIPKLARLLAGGSLIHTFVLCFQLSYFYVSRFYVPSLGDFSVAVYVAGKWQKFTLKHLLDVAGLAEAFVDKDYELETLQDVQYILDLGGHIGDTALYWRNLYPHAIIVVVEPSQETVAYLHKNFDQDAKVKIIQGALATTTGTMDLQLTKNPMGYSLKARGAGVAVETIKTYTLDDICEMTGITRFDILKFDIEGGEDALLAINPSTFAKAYVGEIHLDLLPDITLDNFTKTFANSTLSFMKTKHPKRYIMRALYA